MIDSTVKLTDAEGKFLSQVAADWYVMRRMALLRMGENCYTLTPAARDLCTMASKFERDGLIRREPAFTFQLNGERVKANPIDLTANGRRAVGVWSAQRTESYEPGWPGQ